MMGKSTLPRRSNNDQRVPYPIQEELRQQTLKALAEAAGELRYALGLLTGHQASEIVRKATTDIEAVLDVLKD